MWRFQQSEDVDREWNDAERCDQTTKIKNEKILKASEAADLIQSFLKGHRHFDTFARSTQQTLPIHKRCLLKFRFNESSISRQTFHFYSVRANLQISL